MTSNKMARKDFKDTANKTINSNYKISDLQIYNSGPFHTKLEIKFSEWYL